MDARPYASYLLPETVNPEHYDLFFNIDLDGSKFTGHEDVRIRIEPASIDADGTLVIKLHALELELTNPSLIVESGGTASNVVLTGKSITFDTKRQEAHITFAYQRIEHAISATLHLDFAGALTDGLVGLYKCPYKRADGAVCVGLSSQFEACDARRGYPCWDEPARKATFNIYVEAPAALHVISNNSVDEVRVTGDGSRKTWCFGTTPKMSTYLVALFAGEFDVITATTRHGVQTSVYTPPGKAKQGEFSLDCAVKCLEYFTDAFGVAYPLRKCDLISVEELSAAAMENWGAVSFRSSYLLVDESTSTLVKQRIALVVCHELSHQWFGNLVTMSWWSWLGNNESWAQFMEYLAVEHIYPHWHIFAQFNRSVAPEGFRAAALANTHPIQVHVGDPGEVSEIFDSVTYDTGSMAIRTLYEYLGKDAFFAGLQRYFTDYAYGNTTTDELWDVFDITSGRPVSTIMQNIVSNDGYPYIYVNGDNSDNGSKALRVEVDRFVAVWAHNSGAWPEDLDSEGLAAFRQMGLEGIAAHHSLKQKIAPGGSALPSQRWNMPVSALVISSPGSHTRCSCKRYSAMMLSTDDASAELNRISSDISKDAKESLIKLNAGNGILFRTVYSRSLLDELIQIWTSLPVVDRVGFCDEVGHTTILGYSPAESILKLAKQTLLHPDVGFDSMNRVVHWLSSQHELVVNDSELSAAFARFISAILKPFLLSLGWDKRESDDEQTCMLRALVLQEAIRVGDEAAVAEAIRRFGMLVSQTGTIDPDMKPLLLSAAGRFGGSVAYEKLLAFYRTTDNSEDQRRALHALGGASTPELIQRTLEWALTPEVRNSEFDTPIAAAAEAYWANGPQLVWKFVELQWPEILRRFGSGTFLLPFLVEGMCSSTFASKADYDRLQHFFQTHEHPGAERTAKQQLEGVRDRAWQARLFIEAKPAITTVVNSVIA